MKDEFDIKDVSDDVETLSLNDEVSDKIDEMLDFFDTPDRKLKNKNEQIKIEEKSINIPNSNEEIEITNKPVEEYKPSIKDFNIKSAKKKKIVKKAMLYVIIVMLICFELFINKTGEILDDLKVYATDNGPIRIEQNNKYGYIDYLGRKLVNPKYSYGEEFVKGYAIVKDSSNLPLIINKGGKVVIPTGNYFSLNRVNSEDIIASKVTKSGLKYGILDNNIREKTKFIYDKINYIDNVYTFVKENTVGLINMDGKEIYNYKLTDTLDKTIIVNVSKTNSDNLYASVKINSTYQIINIIDGNVIYNATLNKIEAKENNIFIINENDKKTYLYAYDNKIVFESDSCIDVTINSVNHGIIRVVDNDYKTEFINAKTGNILKNVTESDIYFGDDIVIYKEYNYKTNKEIYNFVKNGEVYKTLEKKYDIKEPFENGIAIVKLEDNLYSYINEDGEIITDLKFNIANKFDKFNVAVAKTENGYGVIDKKGKIIIPFENSDIIMAPIKYKENSSLSDKTVFYAVKKDNRYALYNHKGKKISGDTYYNSVIFDEIYPVVGLENDINDLIYIPKNDSYINLTSSKQKYKVYENYIIIKNEYYNYEGKLIYTSLNESFGE